MAKGPRAVALPEFWILTLASAALHFWRLFTPRAVVFDELHYERFAGYYLNGTHFFDVHPPLGRLMFTGLARILGIGPDALIAPAPEPALRILPALFGTLLVPLVFLLLRQLGGSRRAAVLGAAGVLLDNALLVISRLILPDIFLIVFGLASVSAYLAARTRSGGSRWAFLALSGFLGGCAFSVKWTGASGLGVVLAAWFVDWWRSGRGRSRFIREGGVVVGTSAIVYLVAWAIHFSLITHSGPGDLFMSGRFRMQLPGTSQYNPAAPKLSYWSKLADVHHAIAFGNAELEMVTHPLSSPWYTWPAMKHPMGLWEPDSTQAREGPRTMIVLLGNPVVWWGALIGTALGLIAFFRDRQKFAGYEYGFLLLLGGALLNYVPFMAISRVMYLYHYLFALVYLIALAAFSAGILVRARRPMLAYGAILAVMLAGFIYFAPLTYGFTLSAAAWDQHFRVLHPL